MPNERFYVARLTNPQHQARPYVDVDILGKPYGNESVREAKLWPTTRLDDAKRYVNLWKEDSLWHMELCTAEVEILPWILVAK